jgi:hypothetical protein
VTTHKVLVPFASLHPPAVNAGDLGDGAYALALLRQVGLL